MPTSVPELLPARMLNEFVYCPRLFYFEWVDGRWADSYDTEEGRFAHRAVDKRRGALPVDASDASFTQATALRIESHALKLVGVLDRVESGGDGTVVPVDTKKGKPAEGGIPWSADLVQLYAQAALLRDAGYEVDRGILYYAEVHSRITVPIGNVEVAAAVELADEARGVASRDRPPLPLVGSARCLRCSLAGLCLPDETNALLERAPEKPRRIVPADPDSRPVYVTTPGAVVGHRGGRLRITQSGAPPLEVRLIDVAQLCVYGNVQVSTQALEQLWARGVPVLWLSMNGWLRGWAQGEMSKYVQLRARQVQRGRQVDLLSARSMVVGKIRNCRTLLRRNSRSDVSNEVTILAGMADRAAEAASAGELLGIEGSAARVYFGKFTTMLRQVDSSYVSQFRENGRKRRPAPDPINALLGYVYSLLVKDMVATCIGVGLDPYFGVYHRERYGRPALALDLIEEFRPLIADSVVVGVLNNGEITPGDFETRNDACWLTLQGRRKLIKAYERRMETQIVHPIFKYKISYRRVLDVQARLFAAALIGEVPTYTPMITR